VIVGFLGFSRSPNQSAKVIRESDITDQVIAGGGTTKYVSNPMPGNTKVRQYHFDHPISLDLCTDQTVPSNHNMTKVIGRMMFSTSACQYGNLVFVNPLIPKESNATKISANILRA
jgi:hypothetical protein